MAHRADRPRADRDVEDLQVLIGQAGGADDRVALVDVSDDAVDLLAGVASVSSAIGTVRLTIVIVPPPTSSLYLTSEKSGSTPVVSQSMRNEIVPVGASTVACALR